MAAGNDGAADEPDAVAAHAAGVVQQRVAVGVRRVLAHLAPQLPTSPVRNVLFNLPSTPSQFSGQAISVSMSQFDANFQQELAPPALRADAF